MTQTGSPAPLPGIADIWLPKSAKAVLRRNGGYIKIADLKARTEMFFIGEFTTEVSDRGRKVKEGDTDGVIYVFVVYGTSGEVLGTSSTGTLSLMEDMDKLVRHYNDEGIGPYGPFTVTQAGRAFRFTPGD